MNNPIFHKLKDTIEQPCRSKDWFVLAEQAINTIYALGDHPDELCNEVIKNLTRRAFSRRPKTQTPPPEDPEKMDVDSTQGDDDAPITRGTSSSTPSEMQGEKDAGDAFELSQLLFVVGHVAIKQIVFLELVEREWKRQKDEKRAGIF